MRNRAHSTSYLTYGLQADLLTILYATANCPPMCLYYNIKRRKFQYADGIKKSRSRTLIRLSTADFGEFWCGFISVAMISFLPLWFQTQVKLYETI